MASRVTQVALITACVLAMASLPQIATAAGTQHAAESSSALRGAVHARPIAEVSGTTLVLNETHFVCTEAGCSVDVALYEKVCNGGGSCENIAINCPASQPCTVLCSGNDACQTITVTQPKGQNLAVECTGKYSCSSAAVVSTPGGGETSIDCSAEFSCDSMSVFWSAGATCYMRCAGKYSCKASAVTPGCKVVS